MAQETLQEMGDSMLLAKLDALLAHLERQVGDDAASGWAVSAIGAEVRRRVLREQEPTSDMSRVTVEVEKLNISGLIPPHTGAADFHGAPQRISVTGNNGADGSGPMTVSHGFFTESEADAFLLGLEAARKFGFPFAYVPNAGDDAV